MKIKTHELTGRQLDYAVAVVEGIAVTRNFPGYAYIPPGKRTYYKWTPTTNWKQGGPIIEREGIALVRASGGPWQATKIIGAKAAWAYGMTALEAAARCVVAFKLGDEVEIPEGLK
jgi:hypothetical protein